MDSQTTAILLATVVNELSDSAYWNEVYSGNDVYSGFAPIDIDHDKPWIVCRVIANRSAELVAIRQTSALTLNVQAVGKDAMDCEQAAGDVFKRLQRRGAFDDEPLRIASSRSDDVKPDSWTILSLEWQRELRVDPREELGIRFFERGHQFDVLMRSNHAYYEIPVRPRWITHA